MTNRSTSTVWESVREWFEDLSWPESLGPKLTVAISGSVLLAIFLIVALFFWSSGKPVSEADASELTVVREVKLTHSDGGTEKNYDAVWGPDGQRIAFTSNRSGRFNVWTMSSDGGQFEQLTGRQAIEDFVMGLSSLSQHQHPTWSPSGNRVAYSSNEAGHFDLWIHDLDTSRTRQLAETVHDDMDPTWSNDGEQIAFYSDKGDQENIWKISLERPGDRVALTHDRHRDRSPSWHPEEPLILFSSNRNDNYDLWVVNSDQSGLRKVTDLPGKQLAPAWSPDGEKIAFVSNQSGRWQIWVANKDGSESRQLTHGDVSNGSPHWSPDGRHLLTYRQNSGRYDVWKLTLGVER